MVGALSVALAGTLGWLGHGWVTALVRSRAPGGARSRWVSRAVITLGSALAGATWYVPAPRLLALTLIGSAVLGWWLLCIDAAIHRLPDPLVATLGAVFAAGYLGLYVLGSATAGDLLRSGLAGLAAGAGFTLLALARSRAMGFGDVKLSVVLGLGTGWFGWEVLAQWVLLSFLLAGAFAVFMLITRRLGPRDSIAFGPWMILAAAGAAWLSISAGVTH